MAGPDDQPNIREPSRVPDQERRQDVRADRGRGTQDEFTSPTPAEFREQACSGIQRGHGTFRVREEGATRIGQIHAVPTANEQCGAQFRLERLDPGGQRRLRHVQRTGGAAEIAMTGGLEEALDLAEEHGWPSHDINEIDRKHNIIRLD